MASIQCMQRLHSALLMLIFLPSHRIHWVGQRSITSDWMSNLPQSLPANPPPSGGISPATYAFTASWLIRMSSFHVPIYDISDRAIDATQPLGHPSNLNL